MALAFMLNPATRGRKKRATKRRAPKWMSKKVKNMTFPQCMAAAAYRKKGYKCRTAKDKKLAAKARAAAKRIKKQKGEYGDAMGVIQTNPRKKRRTTRKGGRKMAKKTKRRTKKQKRASAARRGWKTWRRKHGSRKPRVGKRGKRNPSGKRRRRNVWRDDTPGHRKAANTGWRRKKKRGGRNKRKSNPRRRRNPSATMYSGRLYAHPNPRKRRRNARRRRNPFGLGGTFGSITRSLTDPKMLLQFAVGAAGASVSEMLGSFLASKIKEFSPTTFAAGADGKPSMVEQLLGAAARIAAGVLVASFLPGQYKMAWIMGTGAVAAQPLVSGLLKPVLDPIGKALEMKPAAGLRGGIGGWISAAEVYGMPRGSMGGMGAWLTAHQLPGVGVAGLRGGLGYGSQFGSGQYAFQPGMQTAFTM